MIGSIKRAGRFSHYSDMVSRIFVTLFVLVGTITNFGNCLTNYECKFLHSRMKCCFAEAVKISQFLDNVKFSLNKVPRNPSCYFTDVYLNYLIVFRCSS